MDRVEITVLSGIFLISVLAISNPMQADEVFKFKNPSFSGSGTGAHYLTIENQEHSRKKAIKDAMEAARKAAERAEDNTTMAKFIRNLESRIYAQLSKQLVDNMFGICDPGLTECTTTDSGVATVEGAEITWVRDTTTGTITLNIISEDGTTTTISVPIDGFGF